MIEEAFLVLAQAVVVLVIGRSEGGADLVEGRVGRALVVQHAGVAVLVIGHRHRPARHLEKRLALRRADRDVRRRGEPLKNFAISSSVARGLPGMVHGDGHHQARRSVDVSPVALLAAPALIGGSGHEAIAWRGSGRLLEKAEGDADDVGRVGLKNNGAAIPFKNYLGLRSVERNTREQSRHHP